jgi:acetyl-CoA acyltransferase
LGCHFCRPKGPVRATSSRSLQAAGRFNAALVPVAGLDSAGNEIMVERDEHPRPGTTLEKLGELPPAFKAGGVVTAGNSSGIVDGASCVLVASAEKAKALGLKPRARIIATVVVGSEPVIMLTGPIPATRKILKKAGMEKRDIDLVEINEAFATVPLAWSRDLDWEFDNVNVNGCAIALGHPLGASGGMLIGTVMDELERRNQSVGLVTMCIGYGMATATIIDRNV